MKDSIKQELHQLVDKCDNELLLEDARELLQSGKDWWDELSETDRNLVMESEVQYGKGDFINHKELMQRFEEWKKK
jgi:GTPase SAR1 family protein